VFSVAFSVSEKNVGIIVNNISKSFLIKNQPTTVFEGIRNIFSPTFRKFEALKDVSFFVNSGDIVGLIGPNGAGKSTLIKILSGILVPDRGNCMVNGVIPWKNREVYVRSIGVILGQKSQLMWDLHAIDSFLLLKDLYNVPSFEFNNTLKKLLALLKFDDTLNKPVRFLSLGQRMKCELIASLIHKPKVLFLDEPTIGLDAESKFLIRKYIKEINKQLGVTIVITTHDTLDIEALCKNIITIFDGEVFFNGSFDSFMESNNTGKQLIVYLKENINERTETWLNNKYDVLDLDNQFVKIRFTKNEDLCWLLEYFLKENQVVNFDIKGASIDASLVEYYNKLSLLRNAR